MFVNKVCWGQHYLREELLSAQAPGLGLAHAKDGSSPPAKAATSRDPTIPRPMGGGRYSTQGFQV